MRRVIRPAVVIGGALVLLCGCAQPTPPTATPEGPVVARTIASTGLASAAPLPGQPPTIEPAGEPGAPAAVIADPGPRAADLAIEAILADTGVYTLTVRNLGPDRASGIVVSDVLPSGVTPLRVEPAQPVCGRQGRDAGCDLGDLTAGEVATVTLDLTVGGSEMLVTGTHLAGLTPTRSVPVCAIAQDDGASLVQCHLGKLPAGAEAQVCVGLAADSRVTEGLTHTATVTSETADPRLSNNRVTAGIGGGAAGLATPTAVPGSIDLALHAGGPASVTVVVASHDPNVHEAADWVFELRDGQLIGRLEQPCSAEQMEQVGTVCQS